jgi:transcription initiation factor TFIID subunit TAF12
MGTDVTGVAEDGTVTTDGLGRVTAISLRTVWRILSNRELRASAPAPVVDGPAVEGTTVPEPDDSEPDEDDIETFQRRR